LLDWERAAGRLRSSSYIPQEGHANFAPMRTRCANSFAAIRKMAACEWSTPRTSMPGGCQRAEIADESVYNWLKDFVRRCPDAAGTRSRLGFPHEYSVAWKTARMAP